MKLEHILKLIGDWNLSRFDKERPTPEEEIGAIAGPLKKIPTPWRSDVKAYTAKGFTGGEAAQHGRHVFLPPDWQRDWGVMAHELQHVDDARKLGPLMHWLYAKMEGPLKIPYEKNPFERRAERARHAVNAATRKSRR